VSDPLRLAIVGCGDIAGYVSLFARLNPGIRVTAAVDPNGERARQLARRHRGAQVFTDYCDMLDRASPEAVYLAVPHDLHEPMIRQAVERGLHVLVEKPVTRTLAEAVRLAELAAGSASKIGVNYQYRYDRGCYALARAVQRGDLGSIRYAQCSLPWRRADTYFQDSSWHASLERAGGGTLITQGSHLLDVGLWALGEPPVRALGDAASRVFTGVEVEDLAFGVLTLQSGARVQITSSMVSNPEQPLQIRIYGENGTAIYTNQPQPHVRFRGVSPQKERPPARGVHALQRSLEGFRAWVMEDRPYLVPLPAALPALAAVEAIYQSARTGRAVDIDTSYLKEHP
jgi:predicted dehydrogenase